MINEVWHFDLGYNLLDGDNGLCQSLERCLWCMIFSSVLVLGIVDALYLENFFPREHFMRVHFNIIEERFDNLNESLSKLEAPISLSFIVSVFLTFQANLRSKTSTVPNPVNNNKHNH